MMAVPSRSRIAGLLLTFAGAVTFVAAQRFELGTLRSVGPAMFPMVVATLLIALGVAIFARHDREPIDIGAIRYASRGAAVLAGVLAFARLIESAGLVLAGVALVLLSSQARPGVPLGSALALGLVLSVVSAAIFVWALGLPLVLGPRGCGLP